MTKQILILLAVWTCTLPLIAQETTVYTDALRHFKRAEKFADQNLFAKAQFEFGQVVDQLRPLNEYDAELLRQKAELGYAQSAVRLGQKDGEILILDFVRRYSPDPIANQALIEIADFYFNDGDYEKAIGYYQRVPRNGLSREERAGVNFRTGYSYFVRKEFARAKNYFRESKDVQNEFYYPTNYYLGLIEFFDGNYDGAVRQFRIVERSTTYQDYIPYYLAQIYFAQGKYDELIAYAEPKLAGTKLRNEKEVRQLIGQAYFEKGNYAKALPYLEYYAERTNKLREEEFYQLGFTEYQMGKYADAQGSFKEISGLNSQLGQSANYYLADTYLRQGDRSSARYAFGNAMRMSYDVTLQEESTYNYAKLSYELRDPREAIAALQTLQPTSRYYLDAQRLMGDIFLSYRDYAQALTVLDRIPNKTPELREAYQRVTFLRGLQLLQSDSVPHAKVYFDRSLQNPPDQFYQAQALYWLGDIAYRQEDYRMSIEYLNRFLILASNGNMGAQLPAQSSAFTGYYLRGYNYLKQENYSAALKDFSNTVDLIKRSRNFITDPTVREDILGDAVLRTGDAYFKRNQYAQAVRYYDEAVNNRYEGFIYALYQKAIIEGLLNNVAQKILALEQIANQYGQSEYADDALFQLGQTYQGIGQLQQAIPPYQTLVQRYKTNSDLVNESLLQLGLINYNLGSTESAVNYYKQVVSNNPSPSEANRALGALEEIYVRDMGRADLYFAFLETVPGYKVDNRDRDSINFRAAEAQFENGNYQRAIEAYTSYIRSFPNGLNTLTAYYHRGESYAVQRMYSQALQDYEFVVSRGPSRFYLKALEKGAIIAYNSEQDFQKSYDLYTRLEQAANSPDLRFEAQLGAMRSAYRVGNTQAVAIQAQKVSQNPAASTQQRATAGFYLGKIAYDQGDYATALRNFNVVIQTSDNEQTAEARYLKATIYYQQGDLNTAQELTLAANKESSAYPYWVAKSVLLLSDILRDKGDLYNSRAALEALLENYNEDQAVVQEARQKLQRVETMINQQSRLNRQPANTNSLLEMESGGN